MKDIDNTILYKNKFTQEIDNQNKVLKEIIEKFSRKNTELTDSEKEELEVFFS